MSKVDEAIKAELETLVDRCGYNVVLGYLAEIAVDKGQHLRENWQDDTLARQWERLASITEKAQENIAKVRF